MSEGRGKKGREMETGKISSRTFNRRKASDGPTFKVLDFSSCCTTKIEPKIILEALYWKSLSKHCRPKLTRETFLALSYTGRLIRIIQNTNDFSILVSQ